MEKQNSSYVKHIQKDYSLSLKLQIVQEIERGELSTKAACRKYGIQARSTIMSWLQKFGTFDLIDKKPIQHMFDDYHLQNFKELSCNQLNLNL